MKSTATKFITMNPRHCVACWECVEKCPKQVIGKVGFLWHRHVAFKDADACIGCDKCVRTCPNGVFFHPDEAGRTPSQAIVKAERLLPPAFVLSAVTGIGLHVAGHGSDHEIWHIWAVAHVLSSLVWLVAVAFHIRRHCGCYKSVLSKGIGKRSRLPLVLSAFFLFVVITGIVLIAGVDGANSAIGLWHYQVGLLLICLSVAHIVVRKRKK